MHKFLEVTFGPTELQIIEVALEVWRREHALPKGCPELDLAAAVMINLFREGHTTPASLWHAASLHKGLSGLV
jgi:hypothetical protein